MSGDAVLWQSWWLWHIYSLSHVQYLCCWTTHKRHPPSPSVSFILAPSHFLIPSPPPFNCILFLLFPPPLFFPSSPPPLCPSHSLPPLHWCVYDSGGEPSAGCRRQHQDRWLRFQQRVHTGQQAGHFLWLAALRCPRAFPGQEVWWARGGRLESGSHPLYAGQRLAALWWAEPEGKWMAGTVRDRKLPLGAMVTVMGLHSGFK